MGLRFATMKVPSLQMNLRVAAAATAQPLDVWLDVATAAGIGAAGPARTGIRASAASRIQLSGSRSRSRYRPVRRGPASN